LVNINSSENFRLVKDTVVRSLAY